MVLLNHRIPPHTVQADRLKAVIFDWAGTAVDFGSLAPVRTLQRVFEAFGVPIDEADARRDMGLPKRDHIARILSMETIRTAWRQVHGSLPSEADLDAIYRRFVPLQLEALPTYSKVISGVPQAVERARSLGLRIGSTTGYTREMLDVLLSSSAREGFAPECSICPEDVGAGRPLPFMIFENAVRLQVFPTSTIAKVGDTVADIEEGLNAGAWSIGVVSTGNMIGMSEVDLAALPDTDREKRLSAARSKMAAAGAHYVIDTLDDLEHVLRDINSRLRHESSHS